ncbi:hypothetical protein DFR29_11913 [Tahibacter aquaticus]|uniref:Uncharacterized protein n=1 Tax=Tahibacter aquaticus TaxID=520092 RepID=A0A4R6YMJ5_9GAMM|nr:hypothetical protein [Tahibacter aquaticus]TDR38685.1 hypothetical protein DFR29_11913 [Tahibacter aquaticus]
MSSRTKVPGSTQAEVLVQSRRRCCICYGLSKDSSVKKGQIAHLDGDRNNNASKNLAFLCFDHHDEFDSRTSQSKGLQTTEIEIYREELYYTFGSWSAQLHRDELLNFLAFYAADYDAMAKAAIKAGHSVVFYGEELAFDVLVTDQVDYCDGDLYLPHIAVLELFAAWGWLTFSYEEQKDENDITSRVLIRADRKPICDEVAKRLLTALESKQDVYQSLAAKAKHRGWSRDEGSP